MCEDERCAMKNWVEEYLIDSGINLDNVFIQDINSNGSCFTTIKTNRKVKIDEITYSNTYTPNEYNLTLPDLDSKLSLIDFFYNIGVWLHEIGHYIHRHNDQHFESKHKIEYEACLYSEKMLEKMPIYITQKMYFFNETIRKHDINIRKILIEIIRKTNSSYVKTFIKGNNTYIQPEVKLYINRKID